LIGNNFFYELYRGFTVLDRYIIPYYF